MNSYLLKENKKKYKKKSFLKLKSKKKNRAKFVLQLICVYLYI